MRQNKPETLSERDHVLKRSGTYLGDTTPGTHNKWKLTDGKISKQDIECVPAFIKLFDEIISNSIDEAFRTEFKFANEIKVDIDGVSISVEDNGRGIPVEKNEQGDYYPEIAFMRMRSGSNFDDDDYVSIGTNGMGSTLVNIWSSVFEATTDDGKKKYFVRSIGNMDEWDFKVSKSSRQGTSVKYIPDYKRLGLDNVLDPIHASLIEKRVTDLAACYPQIKFRFNGRIVKSKNFETYLKMIGDTYEFIETADWKLAVLPNLEANQISFVNGIDSFRGGTHIESVQDILVEQLRERIKKVHKIDVKPQEIKNHLLFVLIITGIKTPKFDSQTKERITTNRKDYGNLFDEVNNTRFINKIMKNDDIIFPIIETIKLKQQVAEAQALRKAKKEKKKVFIAKHIPANSNDPEKRMLFLGEGDSAINFFSSCRDEEHYGSFPLRGKPLNYRGKKMMDIVKNKELSEIMNIIGLEIHSLKENDYGDLNYGTIVIMADGDVDGYSITGLLINFFMLWPRLFDEGRIKILHSPIVIATKGKQVRKFYSLEDFKFDKYNDWRIKYVKGLGSLTEDEYCDNINDPYLLTVHRTEESETKLTDVYGDDSQKRKIWLQ